MRPRHIWISSSLAMTTSTYFTISAHHFRRGLAPLPEKLAEVEVDGNREFVLARFLHSFEREGRGGFADRRRDSCYVEPAATFARVLSQSMELGFAIAAELAARS